MNVGETCPEPVEGLLTTIAWTVPAGAIEPGRSGEVTHYALEGAIFVTGAAVQWLRDGLGIITDSAEVGPLAESIDDTDGVVVVPAFTGLGSPWWDPYARGTILGITRGTGRAHLARAVIEAMAFQTRDVVDAMTAASGHAVTGLRADGGASVMDLLLRLQADQLQVPVSRPQVQETTALGAAYLAGLAEGVWDSCADISANWVLDTSVEPAGRRPEADAAYARWRLVRNLTVSASMDGPRAPRPRSARETWCRRSAPAPPPGAAPEHGTGSRHDRARAPCRRPAEGPRPRRRDHRCHLRPGPTTGCP
jgi:glycerol kinase